VDCDIDTKPPEALMNHRNAPLTETGRLRLARCVVEDGWPLRRAAERFQVAVTTAHRWASRYRCQGPAGLADRTSRPRTCPRQTPTRTERRIINVRLRRRWGPARIAGLLRLPASTVYRVLTRYRLNRLAHTDRATDHARSTAGPTWAMPTCTALDDHSRLAYTEILPDERKDTAASFWTRAQAFFAQAGITVQRVLTDNGSCYRSHAWRDTLHTAGIAHRRTRPFRPQTNGKVERFHRTLLEEWAYARPYASETDRRAALPTWLHLYNHHRHHTAIGGSPADRVPNLSGQYS
jgi:transposase InsO family protein